MGFFDAVGSFISDVADGLNQAYEEKNRLLSEIERYNRLYGNISGRIEVGGEKMKVVAKESHSERKKNFSRKEAAINYLRTLGFKSLSKYCDDDWSNGTTTAHISVNFHTPIASYDVTID